MKAKTSDHKRRVYVLTQEQFDKLQYSVKSFYLLHVAGLRMQELIDLEWHPTTLYAQAVTKEYEYLEHVVQSIRETNFRKGNARSK